MSAPSPTPAMTAPTQPNRHSTVTITPDNSTPRKIDSKASLNLNPSKNATIEPVQAPVTGKGMETKSISPIRPYLSTSLPRRCAMPKTHSSAVPTMPILVATRLTKPRKIRRKGTGRMLPTTAMGKAKYHGIWKTFIATGSAPLSSTMGSIETINTISVFEIPKLSKLSNTVIPSAQYHVRENPVKPTDAPSHCHILKCLLQYSG